MNQKQFLALYAQCIAVKDVYFAEAKKTSAMLGNCAPLPLSFPDRFTLLCQEIAEKNAHLMYLESKRLLHTAARLGYEAVPEDD